MSGERILVAAPLWRDADVLCRALAEAGFAAESYAGLPALSAALAAGAGAIVVAEEALAEGGPSLRRALAAQPVWSDIPVILLLPADHETPRGWLELRSMLPGGNVTLLSRPVPRATLLSVVETALRARRRQYEVCAYLGEREAQAEELERRVQQRTQALRKLASQLTLAEREERHRISQILHDDLQQQLYALRIQLMMLRESVEAADLVSEVREIEESMGKAIDTARNLSVDLSPAILEGEGLVEGIGWIAGQMHEQYGLQVEVRAEPDNAFPVVDHGRRVLLFQIVRELLFNAVKHAGVARVEVALARADGQYTIDVSDEGKGFDPQAILVREKGPLAHGLQRSRERLRLIGGEMEVESQAGAGTRVLLTVPAEAEEGESLRTS